MMAGRKISASFRTGVRRWLKPAINPELWDLSSKLFRLASQIPTICREVRKAGLPKIILYFGLSPGDDLLCTVVARELKRRGVANIWMCTLHPSLFIGNPDIDHVTKPGPWLEAVREWMPEIAPDLSYSSFDADKDAGTSPGEHILTIMCRNAGIRGPIDLCPTIWFSEIELAQQQWSAGCIAVQSCGMDAASPMQNKQWLPERFQAVVAELATSHRVVQIGSAADPPLKGTVDLRGRTTIREAAAILYHARLYLGTVGMLMHLARASNCPGVIVYGGRERPDQSGYQCNFNLYTPEPCSPCWQYNKCDYGRVCMDKISTSSVIESIRHCLTAQGPERKDLLPLDSALIL